MPDERLPKKVFYGELQVGKRPQGGYKDALKVSPGGFQHTTGVLGTECAGSRKVALPHQKGSRWESARLNESVKSAKPEPMNHHQCHLFQTWLAPFSTDSWHNQPPENKPTHINSNTALWKQRLKRSFSVWVTNDTPIYFCAILLVILKHALLWMCQCVCLH